MAFSCKTPCPHLKFQGAFIALVRQVGRDYQNSGKNNFLKGKIAQ